MLKRSMMLVVVLALLSISGATLLAQDNGAYNPDYVIVDREVTYILERDFGFRSVNLDVPAGYGYTVEVTSNDFNPMITATSLGGVIWRSSGSVVAEDRDDGVRSMEALLAIPPAKINDVIHIKITPEDRRLMKDVTFNMIVSLVPRDVVSADSLYGVTDTANGIMNVCNGVYPGEDPLNNWNANDMGQLKRGYIPARLRAEPGLAGTVVGVIVGAESGPYDEFRVVSGEEVCRDGYYWLEVIRKDGKHGWMATGRDGDYWARKIGVYDESTTTFFRYP
jgi:hypothetical protein